MCRFVDHFVWMFGDVLAEDGGFSLFAAVSLLLIAASLVVAVRMWRSQTAVTSEEVELRGIFGTWRVARSEISAF
jgi:hypothetical protein